MLQAIDRVIVLQMSGSIDGAVVEMDGGRDVRFVYLADRSLKLRSVDRCDAMQSMDEGHDAVRCLMCGSIDGATVDG